MEPDLVTAADILARSFRQLLREMAAPPNPEFDGAAFAEEQLKNALVDYARAIAREVPRG